MTATDTSHTPDTRLNDLAEIISAYNQVTENLQQSHESLRHEVVRLQNELAGADAKLQRSKRLAALGEMAAGIAHEVRNPLAAIQLYADMLKSDFELLERVGDAAAAGVDPAFGAATARKILESVRGLDAIVCDVLSFAGDMDAQPAQLAVQTLFDKAVEACRPAIRNHEVALELNIRDDAQHVHGDADLLHRALLNLIRNAVDAMEESDQPRTLTLGSRVEDGQLVLTVRDTGPGINDRDVDRLFNPFFTTRHTGTGLGLAIVHRIVDAHGGAVSVHNDGGAVFELSLPRPQPQADAPHSFSTPDYPEGNAA